jgi:hypothetical protein
VNPLSKRLTLNDIPSLARSALLAEASKIQLQSHRLGCDQHGPEKREPCEQCLREEAADKRRFAIMIALIVCFAVYSIFIQPR